jgi:hypothetical protein
VASHVFAPLAERESAALGMATLPVTVVPHPIGNLPPEQAAELGRGAVAGVVESLLTGAPPSGMVRRGSAGPAAAGRAADLEAPDEVVEATRLFWERGWGDGLPIVPPTRERVQAMLAPLGRAGEEELGAVPPRWGVATLEVVAANAVMAGCRAEALPVLLAALEACLRPDFNLYGIQGTTGSVTPACIVSGPLAERLGLSGGAGCLGPGYPLNLTLGRALRLVLLDVGGGRPGELDRATQGQPGKLALCFAENASECPWPPLHVELGCGPEQTAVVVAGVMGTTDLIDHSSTEAEDLLRMLSESLAGNATNHVLTGGTSVLVLGPEHARMLAAAGLSRRDVASELARRALVRIDSFPETVLEKIVRVRRPRHFAPGAVTMPVFESADSLLVVVAGGAGPHDAFLPSYGESSLVQAVALG